MAPVRNYIQYELKLDKNDVNDLNPKLSNNEIYKQKFEFFLRLVPNNYITTILCKTP